MTSSTYQLIVQAMTERKQVLCMYEGFARALCPIVLGHKQGRERLLAFQFAGGASKGLPPGGQWKCFDLAKMTETELRRGRWHAGTAHTQPQHCVDEVDLDINPESPYAPRRRLRDNAHGSPRKRERLSVKLLRLAHAEPQ
jgi:hypothetical protein